MPTYQDALSAEPSEFLAFASEMIAAATDLATQQTDYAAEVAEINRHWQDTANEAFNGEAGNVDAHLAQVIGEVTAAAGGLAAAGAQMLAECTVLKAADAALKATGFTVQPAPLVTLGPSQRTAIAMAGPFGGFIEAVLQAQAMAGTLGLQSMTALVNAADATAGAALSQAAELLKPLDDKTSGTDRDLQSHAVAEDHSTGGTEEEEAAAEEEAEEEPQEATTEEEQESTEQEPREPTRPPSGQPTTPGTPTGMEDLAQPEMPDFDDPWGAAELPGTDDVSGGLASGGGLGAGGAGGGLGAGSGVGGLATGIGTAPQGGMGGGAMVGAATGGVGAAGRGKGAGGGMMGAGGGRGAGSAPDDETTRESTLTEDPDEDVWGIAEAADDRYE
ncbi:hypothetical protein K3N28_16580 [Glycomyces sp. TRM65418]|uniref:hypothetical protein n=1 Tax=Glycomyces sp. TRM65418 TaxID=2867006 RepID=UPI001CE69C6C|nr:hypothetical protein [Glycomyces sp. TRM65418]MCC3764675.1 hypothetical protein [Glycomyces sp. TRM65418]QZD54335.1 hypothetical protein K3N28_16495 [Glycomyces sp. TRM65418]